MQNILCIDAVGTGRMHPFMLSDQQMMELFFTPDKPEIARARLGGDADDACTWTNVQCEEGRVTDISWNNKGSKGVLLAGSIDMARLPRSLELFTLYQQPLQGEAHTTNLPETLYVFSICFCRISGTLDLGNLPAPMVNFTVRGNAISAIVNVCGLPEKLELCQVQHERIANKVLRVGKLPQNDLQIRLQGCGITDVLFEDSADAMRVLL